MTTKALVVLSGGQDSTTCLFWALYNFDEVTAVTYDYGQRHAIELQAAATVVAMARAASGYDFEHEIVEIGPILQGLSPLVSDERLEQYADHASLPGGLEKTFVPMRNQLFLTLAANHAYVRGIHTLVTGVCQEDFGGYPDCRQGFIDSFVQTASAGTFTGEPDTLPNLVIKTPLMNLTKAQAVHLAYSMPLCWEALAYTHTAYDGLYPPTGHDHASLLREKGFFEAGRPDPLVLRAVSEGLMALPLTSNYRGF